MPAYFTDDFNRANSTDIGVDWVNDVGWLGAGLSISSNTLTQTTVNGITGAAYSTTQASTSAMFAEVTDVQRPGGTCRHRLCICMADDPWDGTTTHLQDQTLNTNGYTSGYQLFEPSEDWGGGISHQYLVKSDGATNSLVATDSNSGDRSTTFSTWRLEHDGSGEITGYIDGVESISYSDGTPLTGTTAGYGMLSTNGSNAPSIGSFSAGDLTVQHWLHYDGYAYQDHSFPTWMVEGDTIVVCRARNYGSLTAATGWTTLTGSTSFYQVLERELDATDISNGYVTLDGQPAWGDTAMIGHYLESGTTVNLSIASGTVGDTHPNTITGPDLTTTADGATVYVDIRAGSLTGGSANLTGQPAAWGTAQYLWGPSTGGEFYSYTEPTAGAIGTTDLSVTLGDWDAWAVSALVVQMGAPTQLVQETFLTEAGLNSLTTAIASHASTKIIKLDIASNASAARTAGAAVQYWFCDAGTTPTNAIAGDIIYTRS